MAPIQTGQETTIEQVFLRAGVPSILTLLLVFLAFLFPLVDSTRAPYIDLTREFSQLAYWFSQSGGKVGATIIALLLLAFFEFLRDIKPRQRLHEASVILLITAIFAGGGSALNEYVVKEQLKIPRPNIIFLAGEHGSGLLGMAPEAFYEHNSHEARRTLLEKVLNTEPQPVPLSSSIKAHWLETTGYSFPSGHSFSAMFFATFYLMIAATYLAKEKLMMFYVLLPWALAVCYSRSILRVHTPIDISVGGLFGLTIGLIAWAAARTLISRFSR